MVVGGPWEAKTVGQSLVVCAHLAPDVICVLLETPTNYLATYQTLDNVWKHDRAENVWLRC